MMINFKSTEGRPVVNNYMRVIPFMAWLGGAVHTMNQPGMGFWDGMIWLYYVGQYVATNFTMLHG